MGVKAGGMFGGSEGRRDVWWWGEGEGAWLFRWGREGGEGGGCSILSCASEGSPRLLVRLCLRSHVCCFDSTMGF